MTSHSHLIWLYQIPLVVVVAVLVKRADPRNLDFRRYIELIVHWSQHIHYSQYRSQTTDPNCKFLNLRRGRIGSVTILLSTQEISPIQHPLLRNQLFDRLMDGQMANPTAVRLLSHRVIGFRPNPARVTSSHLAQHGTPSTTPCNPGSLLH